VLVAQQVQRRTLTCTPLAYYGGGGYNRDVGPSNIMVVHLRRESILLRSPLVFKSSLQTNYVFYKIHCVGVGVGGGMLRERKREKSDFSEEVCLMERDDQQTMCFFYWCVLSKRDVFGVKQ
jgi:hypothetical protein